MIWLVLLSLACVAFSKELRVRLAYGGPRGTRVVLHDLPSSPLSLGEAGWNSFSAYFEVEQERCCGVSIKGSNASIPVRMPSDGSSGSRATVFVAWEGAGAELHARLLWDDYDGDDFLGVDHARVRFLHAIAGVGNVQVTGVTSDCHNCLQPPLGQEMEFGQASSHHPANSLVLDVDHPFLWSATRADDVWGREGGVGGGGGVGGEWLPSRVRSTLPAWWRAMLAPVSETKGASVGEWLQKGGALYAEEANWAEHGVYTVLLTRSEGNVSKVVAVQSTDAHPDASWVAVVVAAMVVLVVIAIVLHGPLVLRASGYGACVDFLCGKERTASSGKRRVEAIDTFRGICLSIMIFVNYGGGGYWWLDHSRWDGLTVADLVFPAFVWTMGASMALSHRGMRRRGQKIARSAGGGGGGGGDGGEEDWRVDASKKTVVRAVKLYLLGMFLNGCANLENCRIPGVLQYFGVATFIVGLADIWIPKPSLQDIHGRALTPPPQTPTPTPPTTTTTTPPSSSINLGDEEGGGKGLREPLTAGRRDEKRVEGGCGSVAGDFLPYVWEWAVVLSLIGVYLGLQYGLDVEGCGRGYIGPGGLGDWGKFPHCTGGAHRVVDLAVFGGEKHLYHDISPSGKPVSAATCADTYHCPVYDPEGFMGYATSTLMAFLGLQAGRILLAHQPKSPEASAMPLLTRWVAWGVVLGSIGTGLAGGSKFDGVMPLNKNLWSPSFVSVMAGVSFCSVALLFVICDRALLWSGLPFAWLGKNSIAVYAGSEILQPYFPFSFFLPHSTHASLLASNIIGVACWMVIAWKMYQAGVMVKL